MITFIESGSTTHEVDVEAGQTLMEGAVQAGVDGIVAECGGSCSCATCHCYIQEEWLEIVGEPEALEADMLEMAVDPRPNSRLSCQITVSDEMNGMIVRLPESQF